MSKETSTPEAAYLTSPNIIHPQSERGSAGESNVAAAEAVARADLAARTGVTITGGSIKRGR